MTYNELLEQLPPTIFIPTLGGKARLTIINQKHELMARNSKGSAYRLTREDWINAKRIRNSHPANPWRSALYSEASSVFSYGLPYAAALLRHVEGRHATRPSDVQGDDSSARQSCRHAA